MPSKKSGPGSRVDIYGILELSKLSEAILFANKIVTLEGGEQDNTYVHELRRNNILLDNINDKIERGSFFNKASLEDSFLKEFLSDQHIDNLAHKITAIFSVDYQTAREAIQTSRMRNITHNEFLNYQIADDKSNADAKNAISENYLRTLRYMDLASSNGLNYSPDSFRIPIVDYIDSTLVNKLKTY